MGEIDHMLKKKERSKVSDIISIIRHAKNQFFWNFSITCDNFNIISNSEREDSISR